MDKEADLYSQHAPGALRLAYVLTGDLDVAHDLVQDAFVKVLRRPGFLRSGDAFEAYLRTTIVNLVRSRWRRINIERRSQPILVRASATLESAVEERDVMQRALRALPPRQRLAVALRYLEDLSEQETAEALGISVPAVKSLVQRGVASLRRELEVNVEH